MTLSILMAVYNNLDNVTRTLEKLHNQQNGRRIQVIVVNDGSSENDAKLLEACEMYGYEYYYQNNAGEAATRQATLDKAESDYCTWIDADDSITDDYLDVILNEIEDDQYDFITHPWRYIDGRAGTRHDPPLVNWNVWANVYRTSKVKNVPFDLDMRIASDTEWLKRAITPDMRWLDSDKVINLYNDENPDSLTNQFTRGEIKVRFSDDR